MADKWKVIHLAKDELDLTLKNHMQLPCMVAIQVFGNSLVHAITIRIATVVSRLIDHSHSIGHKMEVHTIRLQNGISV